MERDHRSSPRCAPPPHGPSRAHISIRIGHAGEDDADISEVTTVSVGVGFGKGTTVAVAWSQNDASDHEYQYMKVDHSYGDGSIAVYYKRGEDADSSRAVDREWRELPCRQRRCDSSTPWRPSGFAESIMSRPPAWRAEVRTGREAWRAEVRADRAAFESRILRLTEQEDIRRVRLDGGRDRIFGGHIESVRNQLATTQ